MGGKESKSTRLDSTLIRHTAGTLIRNDYVLEVAQLFLGHANAKVTQIYAETDQRKTLDLARRIG